jgi:hypothetical protein
MPGIKKWRELGLCLSCGKQPEIGRVRCRPCLDKSRLMTRTWRAKTIADRKCTACGATNELPGVYCSPCKTKKRDKRFALKAHVMQVYGNGCCACCGETELGFLTIDHVNNDGAAHRRRNGGSQHAFCGVEIYAWLRRNNYPEGFQVLCYNCNCAKGKLGECPHETKRKAQALSS